MRRIVSPILVQVALIIVAAMITGHVRAETTPRVKDAQVKAAIAFNLIKFVDWPKSRFMDDSSPLVLGTYGETPFTSEILFLHDKQIGSRPLIIKDISNAEDLDGCHVLVIGDDTRWDATSFFELAAQHNVFTISDAEGFAFEGGMAELFLQEGKVRFHINHLSIKTSQLAISAQVLKLAANIYD